MKRQKSPVFLEKLSRNRGYEVYMSSVGEDHYERHIVGIRRLIRDYYVLLHDELDGIKGSESDDPVDSAFPINVMDVQGLAKGLKKADYQAYRYALKYAKNLTRRYKADFHNLVRMDKSEKRTLPGKLGLS